MKRDRHGILRARLPDAVVWGVSDPAQGVTKDDLDMARMGVHWVGYFARSVFRGRNAQFIKKSNVRAVLRPTMRPHLRRVLGAAKRMRAALLRLDWRAAESEYRAAVIELQNADAAIRDAERPVTMAGKKFTAGRKPGTLGPVRRAIRKLLNANRQAKTPDLWKSIAAKPPRGWEAFDNRHGRYLEGPTAADKIEYSSFGTYCSEERKRLKTTK